MTPMVETHTHDGTHVPSSCDTPCDRLLWVMYVELHQQGIMFITQYSFSD